MSYNPNEKNLENINRLRSLVGVSGQALIDYGLGVILPKLEENFYKFQEELGEENFKLLKDSFKSALENQRGKHTKIKKGK